MSAFGLLAITVTARMAAMVSSCTAWVAAPELFPTELRTTGHSIASIMAQIGGFCAPFIVGGNYSPWAVAIGLAVVNAIAAAACLCLSELVNVLYT